jgi:hypothetical protein
MFATSADHAAFESAYQDALARFRHHSTPAAQGAAAKANTPPLATRLYAVLWRTWLSYWRDAGYNTVRAVMLALIGTVIGAIFFDIDDTDEAGVSSVVGATFIILTLAGVMGLNASIPKILDTRPTLYRELAAGYYPPEFWALAMFLAEIPFCAVAAVSFALPFHLLVGLELSTLHLRLFLLVAFAAFFALVNIAHLLAVALPTPTVATAAAGMVAGLSSLFCGLVRFFHRKLSLAAVTLTQP